MERLNYSPDEIREAFRYLREQGEHLRRAHAGNWRSKFTIYIDGVRLNQEALKLLSRILDGHPTASGSKWYKLAADRQAPPLPQDRYERCALVWKLVTMAMQKTNPDGFDAREKVDLPYVLVNSDLPGGGLSEKFEALRVDFLVPFADTLDQVGDEIVAALPASGSLDFWDAAVAVLTKSAKPAAAATAPPTPAAEAPAGAGAEEASAEAKDDAKPAKKKTTKRKPTKEG